MTHTRTVSRFALLALALLSILAIQRTRIAKAETPTDLIISEYVEGSSLNKALEFYNGTGAAIDLAAGDYSVEFYANANTTAGLTIDLVGTIANGDVFVLAQASAVLPITPDQTNTSTSWYNGNDTVVLKKGTTIIDSLGKIAENPAEWGTGDTSTLDNTLRRKPEICTGDIDPNDAFDPSIEWIGYPNNTFDGLGSHTANCGATPTLSLLINDVSLNEGNAGTTSFEFTVSLTAPAGAGGVTFDIATADNTATTAGNDYVAKSLTGQTISAGSSTYGFTVDVNGDTTAEPNETFFVNVTNMTGATVIDGQGQGTIVNDEVPVEPIYNIQGSGSSAAITGVVTTEGIVVGDFQTSAGIQGFYMQDATGDGNDATSDGIFVFTGATDNTVSAGDCVRVTGYARERFNQTTLNGSNTNNDPVPAANIIDCGDGSVTAVDVNMPFASTSFPERYEGMLVRFAQTLVITEYFNYDQFGEIVLALPLTGEERHFTGTAIDEPGAPALARAAANAVRRITLDDNQGGSNPVTLRHPNGDPFALNNRFRGGDEVANAVGVLGYDFNLYRIFPTGPADYTAVNPRPAAPDPVGGRLRVAVMNTLNFFLTPDAIQEPPNTANDPNDDVCGGGANLECRGFDGDQPSEFTRQRDKLLEALAGLDADIIGLNEIENTPGVEPLGDPTIGIVASLNDMLGAGTYDYIDTGVIGTDAIRVGIIYKPAKVTPVGTFQTLDSSDDPRFASNNRPALAQTFEEVGTGARFTVAVNHLKSKGSCPSSGVNDDQDDGQGCWNPVRLAAAQALVDWLATDPTGSGDPDFLIMGDLNSYAMEDPIDAIKLGSDDTANTSDDYVNLIAQYEGLYAYSYTFDGQAGYLDHALAINSLASQVTGATEWHINSDEPDAVDYDTTFKPPTQEALYEDNPYRSSDHDAALIGLNLTPPPDTTAPTVTINQASGQADSTSTSPILFTVVFSEPVTGFGDSAADVTLSGTAGATTAVVTEVGPMDGTTYNVAVSGMTGDGTVIASLAADVAEDGAGNGNTASTSTDNTVTYDATQPDTTITANPTNPSASSSASFSFTGSDGGTGVASFECQFDGGGWSACTSPQNYLGLSDGSHTFEVRAIDGAGNVDPTPASYTWVIDTSTPPSGEMVYMTTTAPGSVDGVWFDKNDILLHDGAGNWSLFWNGTAAGLPAKADITAIHVNNSDDLYLSFTQNNLIIPGLGKVNGSDVVHYNGGWSWYFDGSDVDLTTGNEKVDSLHILPGSAAPVPGCVDYLLISTRGKGRVSNPGEEAILFSGEDVLGFCLTSVGQDTDGLWFMVLDGSAVSMPNNSTISLSANEDGTVLYLTTRAAFNVDGAVGGHSMVYRYDTVSHEFSGLVFSAPAEGLSTKVDGLHMTSE